MSRRSTPWWSLSATASVGLILAGCGGKTPAPEAETAPPAETVPDEPAGTGTPIPPPAPKVADQNGALKVGAVPGDDKVAKADNGPAATAPNPGPTPGGLAGGTSPPPGYPGAGGSPPAGYPGAPGPGPMAGGAGGSGGPPGYPGAPNPGPVEGGGARGRGRDGEGAGPAPGGLAGGGSGPPAGYPGAGGGGAAGYPGAPGGGGAAGYPGAPGGGPPAGYPGAGGGGAAGYPGAPGGGRGGPAGGPGDGVAGGPGGGGGGGSGRAPEFKNPTQGATAFLDAVKARNIKMLKEAVALHSKYEATADHKKLFENILDDEGGPGQEQMDELFTTFDGFTVSRESASVNSTATQGVIVSKTAGGKRLERTVYVRQEKAGWKVNDFGKQRDFKTTQNSITKKRRGG